MVFLWKNTVTSIINIVIAGSAFILNIVCLTHLWIPKIST